MEPLELFLRCTSASCNRDVEAALNEFAEAHGLETLHDLPIAVGKALSNLPPHRSVQAQFRHTALTSSWGG